MHATSYQVSELVFQWFTHQLHGKSELPDLFKLDSGMKITQKHIYEDIVFRLYRKTQLEPEVLICAAVLFRKLLQHCKVTRFTLKVALCACIMIESKLNDDRGMKLPSFARHMGLNVDALMEAEVFVCRQLDWHIYVKGCEYQELYQQC